VADWGIDNRRRWWLGSAVIASSIALATPALAQAESLTITSGGKPTLGQPLSITAKGIADGAHSLFVYADYSGYSCASNPYNEHDKASVVALSSVTGDPLAAGSYSMIYSYTPTVELFRICGYLDDTPSDVPDVSASDTPADPVNNQEPELPTGTWSGPPVLGSSEPPHITLETAAEYYERVAREQAAQKAGQQSIIQRCVVPSLKGESLSRAKQALLHAHCKLGKVHRDRGARGTLVVTGQTPSHDKTLSQGAAVAVTLGSRKR